MFVFPTSMTSSMAKYAYLAERPSVFHFDLADHVPLGDGGPVALGAADPRELAVQVRVAAQRDEELARPGVASRQSDADVESLEGDRGSLASQKGSRTSKAVPPRISELDHEPRHDAVEDEAAIESPTREGDEPQGGDGGEAWFEDDGELPRVRLEGDSDADGLSGVWTRVDGAFDVADETGIRPLCAVRHDCGERARGGRIAQLSEVSLRVLSHCRVGVVASLDGLFVGGSKAKSGNGVQESHPRLDQVGGPGPKCRSKERLGHGVVDLPRRVRRRGRGGGV